MSALHGSRARDDPSARECEGWTQDAPGAKDWYLSELASPYVARQWHMSGLNFSGVGVKRAQALGLS